MTGTFRKTCYHHSTESLTAIQAAVKCAIMGGRLYSRLSPNYADSVDLWVGKFPVSKCFDYFAKTTGVEENCTALLIVQKISFDFARTQTVITVFILDTG